MGGSWIEDSSPGSPFRLRSVNTTLRLGSSSTIVIEGAQSTGTINTGIGGTPPSTAAGVDPEGSAARIEWRHESSRLIARAFGAITDPGFSNPASTLTGGRTEAGGRARLAITDAVHIIGEAIHSEDRLTDGRRDGGLLAVETKWRPLVFELGLRRATETGAPAQGTSAGFPLFGSQTPSGGFGFGSTNTSIDPVTGQPIVQPGFGPQLSAGANAPATDTPLDVMTVRGKLTFLFGKRANVYGEGEQDVRASARRVAAVGTQFLITDRVKLYGRHEFISSLDGPYALTEGQRSYNTVFGVASSYMKDGDVFSEYRLADAISGREAEAAIGLRNQWTLAEGVRLSTGFERLHAIAGVEREATAASVGLEYTRERTIQEHGTPRVAERFVERQLAVHRRLRAEAVAQLDDAGQELLSADRARGRAEPGAGSLLDRRGVPGYDDEPPQPADALRVQGRRHARPVARHRNQSTGAGGVDARRRPPAACVDVLGPARGEVRRRSNGGQPWPIRHPAGLGPRRL